LLIGIGLRIDPLVNTNICFDQSVRQMALCDNPAIHRCGHLSLAELTSFSDRSDTRNQLVGGALTALYTLNAGMNKPAILNTVGMPSWSSADGTPW